MKLPESLKRRFKDKKKLFVAILILSFGILLILLSAISSSDGSDAESPVSDSLAEYKERLEAELADLCSSVNGVGKCRVMVTFERGAETTYKGSLLTESKPPRVLGVSVVCRGGDSDAVKSALSELLSALFEIGKNRIAVLKLNS